MARGDPNKLTDYRQRFVDALLEDPDLSPREAYLKAGYAKSGLESQPYVLLRDPKIMRALDAEMAKRATRTRITKDRVLREIASMAFSSIDDYEVGLDGEIKLKDHADYRAMKAVQSVERDITYDKEGSPRIKVKLKLWDKTKAVDQLARHLNLFREDQEAGAPKIAPYNEENRRMALKLMGVEEDENV